MPMAYYLGKGKKFCSIDNVNKNVCVYKQWSNFKTIENLHTFEIILKSALS